MHIFPPMKKKNIFKDVSTTHCHFCRAPLSDGNQRYDLFKQTHTCTNKQCEKIRGMCLAIEDKKITDYGFNLATNYRLFVKPDRVYVWITGNKPNLNGDSFPEQITLPFDRFDWFNVPIKTIREYVDGLLLLS